MLGRYLFWKAVRRSILLFTPSKRIKNFAMKAVKNDGNAGHGVKKVRESTAVLEKKNDGM